MYERSPTVTTIFRKRLKPSNMVACRMLVISLENAISGELATRIISAVNAGSQRTTSQSSFSDVSVPESTVTARNATAGNGGSAFMASRISRESTALLRIAVAVPIRKRATCQIEGFGRFCALIPIGTGSVQPPVTQGRVSIAIGAFLH